jgi:hypothetical protein
MASSSPQIGSMSSVRMRVAIRDWWASRRMTSVMPTGRAFGFVLI